MSRQSTSSKHPVLDPTFKYVHEPGPLKRKTELEIDLLLKKFIQTDPNILNSSPDWIGCPLLYSLKFKASFQTYCQFCC